jgi:SAM-dependent methyltransferase
MTTSQPAAQHAFTETHYGPRAAAYVASAVHSGGADLDEMEAALQEWKAARALDLGCGGGHVTYRAAPHVGAIVAVDVTEAMLAAVEREAASRGLRNVTTRRAAAEDLPFEDAAFDVVLCRFTAHHWQGFEAGLREARRVLKPGGRAIFIDVTAPADPLLDTHLQTVELLRDVSHVRDYSVAEWTASLARAGFALDRLTPRRLRMDYPVWIARTQAPETHAAAIRSLQQGASSTVKDYFAIDDGGSFDIDVTSFQVRTLSAL